MDIVGDEILRVLHDGGVQHDDVVVDTFGILLKSGRCVELAEDGPALIEAEGLKPNPIFDRYVGLRIVAIESSEYWPTCGGTAEQRVHPSHGQPHPYYWGMQEADA